MAEVDREKAWGLEWKSMMRRVGNARPNFDLHREVVVVLVGRHHDQGVFQVRLPGGFLLFPDLVQTLPADASAKVGMELLNGSCQLRGER